jgi:hypothetical protein
MELSSKRSTDNLDCLRIGAACSNQITELRKVHISRFGRGQHRESSYAKQNKQKNSQDNRQQVTPMSMLNADISLYCSPKDDYYTVRMSGKYRVDFDFLVQRG